MLISKEVNYHNQPKSLSFSIGETVRVIPTGLVGRVISVQDHSVSVRLDEGSVIVCPPNHLTSKQVLMEG